MQLFVFIQLYLQIKGKTLMYLVVVDNVQNTNSKIHVYLMLTDKFTSMCLMGKHHVAQNSNVYWFTEISRTSSSRAFKRNAPFRIHFNKNPLSLIPL